MPSLTPDSGPGAILVDRKLVAVLILESVDEALPVAESLLTGGVDVIELTLRTPAALEAARRIRETLPEMTVGIGTILTAEHVKNSHEIGAHFGVSPGVNPEIMKLAREIGLPFGPGVVTPTDIDLAIREGTKILKFFPAESSGGLAHLKNIAAPFAHLGPRFVPLGGVTLDNMEIYLKSDFVAAVGGSWLAPRHLIEAQDWEKIEGNAREARKRSGVS